MPPSSQDTKWSLSRGNGIGPEVTDAVQRILDAARAPIAWVECRAGLHASDTARIPSTSSISKVQRTPGPRQPPNNP